ncbi:hypothetical protein SDC9_132230 [bioreactor metagenome]|uniref:Uncharacterized protein n=1 Tax=bioreactor metagenome TaxID=1076179 RepID=A0A645D885_9ZZZZ
MSDAYQIGVGNAICINDRLDRHAIPQGDRIKRVACLDGVARSCSRRACGVHKLGKGHKRVAHRTQLIDDVRQCGSRPVGAVTGVHQNDGSRYAIIDDAVVDVSG